MKMHANDIKLKATVKSSTYVLLQFFKYAIEIMSSSKPSPCANVNDFKISWFLFSVFSNQTRPNIYKDMIAS